MGRVGGLAAEEAATVQRRTQAVGVNRGRVWVSEEDEKEQGAWGLGSDLNGRVSGGSVSCNTDLELSVLGARKLILTQDEAILPQLLPQTQRQEVPTTLPARCPEHCQPAGSAKVPADGLGFLLTCHISHRARHTALPFTPESSLVLSKRLSHPDYISSWFLIILYQLHKFAAGPTRRVAEGERGCGPGAGGEAIPTALPRQKPLMPWGQFPF